jgi:phage terminase large subunit
MNEKVVRLKNIVGSGYKRFWDTRKRYRVVVGGRGSKKSTTASLWFIYNMMKIELANTLVLRKVYKDHKDSTFAQLKWAINRLGVEDYWHSRLNPLELHYLPTGQKILFRGLDEPQSITSITVEYGYLCWVWFEEFFQINSEQDFNMVDMSIRGEMPEGLFKQITGTLNPWNEKHWIKKRFFDDTPDNTFTDVTTYHCNEFLDEDDIAIFEEMKVRNPRRYRVEGLGEWGIAEGLVYDNWIEQSFDKDELIKERPHLLADFGLDFGYTADPSALICTLIDKKKKELFIFDEHYQRGMRNEEIAEMLKYKGYAKERIIADSAEPKSIDEIKYNGINRIAPAQKGKDSILNGIQFLQGYKIIVHPKCTNTIFELNNYAWDTKEGQIINKPVDDFNHLMDALRYAVEKHIVSRKITAGKSIF